ncbi:MAG TPA: hypothetical protein VHX88_19000 [Solirubrobacteraceae bacterium]|jgi:hypothetical protein|nr:hypothetical protein [Solirubrobacteraceae bacterium]
MRLITEGQTVELVPERWRALLPWSMAPFVLLFGVISLELFFSAQHHASQGVGVLMAAAIAALIGLGVRTMVNWRLEISPAALLFVRAGLRPRRIPRSAIGSLRLIPARSGESLAVLATDGRLLLVLGGQVPSETWQEMLGQAGMSAAPMSVADLRSVQREQAASRRARALRPAADSPTQTRSPR